MGPRAEKSNGKVAPMAQSLLEEGATPKTEASDHDVRRLDSTKTIEATYGGARYQVLLLMVVAPFYTLGFLYTQVYIFVAPKVGEDKTVTVTQAALKACEGLVFSGWAVGSLVISPLADLYGRRKVTLATAAMGILGTALEVLALSEGWVTVASLAFFTVGVSLSGSNIAYVLIMEALPERLRAAGSTFMTVAYSFLFGLFSLAAFLCRDLNWRLEMALYFTPMVIVFFLAIFLVHESLPFLQAKGRWGELRTIAAAIAMMNKAEDDWEARSVAGDPSDAIGARSARSASDFVEGSGTARSLRSVSESSFGHAALLGAETPPITPAHLFPRGDGPNLFSKSSCVNLVGNALTWTVSSLVYYGLSFSAGNMSSNLYLNVALLACVDVVGSSLLIPVMSVFGLRGGQQFCFVGVAVCLVGCGLFATPGSMTLLFFLLLGRLLLDVTFNTMLIFSVECFPSEVRSTASGIVQSISRFSTSFAPFMSMMPVSESLPIWGLLCVLAAIATIFLSTVGPRPA
mmetsp:Transcript_24195/g.53671  ORF Transcript_24195/g.53671 Transcript_24195/m.53671 type:complete len:516 (-) Transcript_24195:343-1890(-)